MALPKFNKETFRKSVLGAGGTIALALSVSPANAENDICLPLTQINGITLSADATADRHSRSNPGVISIATLPGGDMRNSPENLTKVFRKKGIGADCFLNNSMASNYGTEFSLYVAGNPVKFNGKTSFGIQELRDNPEILRTAHAEAIVSKQMLAGTVNTPRLAGQ
ncbi:MAG TPA: hypothetical protein PK513_00715 [Alphaproteobacteria bacterium]|nr:hypothetical protein [Alphaproteobacteria bacterium]USO05221.1 MAG: hypothetical protein H6859_08705 [Rhodospirillales bacterium]HOO81010.1 hypothetical protein [Alphaproteobacteria bacterium]